LLAFADHGEVNDVMPADGGYAEAVIAEFNREGLDDLVLAGRLQREGVEAFAKSWREMLSAIEAKGSRSVRVSAA
jgi:transaldolase